MGKQMPFENILKSSFEWVFFVALFSTIKHLEK